MESLTLELLHGQADLLVGLVQFLDSAARRPDRLVVRQDPEDLGAVHTIVSRVGTGALSERDLRAGHDLSDYRRKLANAKVLLGQSDVECLIVYRIARRLEGRSVTANCLHPGAVSTRLGANNGWIGRAVTGALSPFFLSPQRGAETSIYLAAAVDVEGVIGRYFVKKRERRPSATSLDLALAAKLWDASCELTGVRSFGQVDADDAHA